MIRPPWLTTDRLALRRLTADDFDLLWRLNSDDRVTRYIGGYKDREKIEHMLAIRVLEYYEQHPGLGIWATIERASGRIVGLHLLNHIQGESYIQVGYLMFPEFWGQGYATEMAAALVRYGFLDLALPQVVAITDLDHIVSQRVLVKAGLERKGERAFAHPAYASQGPLAWFERDREEWLADHR